MTNPDGQLDARLDERLARAGARWRERNATPAAVDLAAATTTPARRAGDPAPEPTPSGPALPLLPAPPARPGRRRLRIWLAAGAAAAVVAGLTLGLLQLTGGPSGATHPAADGVHTGRPGSDRAGPAVIGPYWRLVGMTGPDGTAVPVTSPAHFQLEGGGFSFSDGCNSGGGEATIAGSTITFESVGTTLVACVVDGSPSEEEALIVAVFSESVHWAVRGGTLTLSKPGTGTLRYVAASSLDPADVFTGTWTLRTVQPGNNIARAYGTAPSAPASARVSWGEGRLTGFDGCNSFRAAYHYAGESGGGSLRVSDVTRTSTRPCNPGIDDTDWVSVLSGATHWSYADGRLVVTDAHDGSLTFTGPNR